MVVAGAVFFCAPDILTSFFTGSGSSPTAEAAAPLLRIVALATPSLALVMILTGALRGAGDTGWPLVISLIGFLGIRLPGACILAWDTVSLPFSDYVLPGLGWGVCGAWYAMLADNLLRSALVALRFWHGSWMHIKV